MGNPFKTPKKVDMSKQNAALDRQEKLAVQQEEEQKKQLAARRRASRRGARSLITSSETGETSELRKDLG